MITDVAYLNIGHDGVAQIIETMLYKQRQVVATVLLEEKKLSVPDQLSMIGHKVC